MRYLSIILSFLLFVGCEKSPESNDKHKVESVLNIAIASDYPPYIYSKDGKLAGFEIDP